jgi:hypothetical protein
MGYRPPMIRCAEVAHSDDLVIVEVTTPATTMAPRAEPRSPAPMS